MKTVPRPPLFKYLDSLEEKLRQMLPSTENYGSVFQDLMERIRREGEILIFKNDRTVKEKSILMSLLTKTSKNLSETVGQLKHRAEELETVLDTIPAFVYFKDLECRYILVNRAFEDLFKLKSNEIVGKTLDEFFPNRGNYDFHEKEKEVLANSISLYNIEELLEIRGEKRFLSTNLAPIRNSQGMTIGLIGISLEITDRKLAEFEMIRAKELAEAGTKAKSEFLANMSHEIRTPMSAIIGSANILKQTPLDSQQVQYVEILSSSGKSLLNIINDILDFSKIEAGKIDFESIPFEIRKVVGEIENLHRFDSENLVIDYQTFVDPDIPEKLVGDPFRLRQILLNLTNNAIKFTSIGHVHVYVDLAETMEGEIKLKFRVEDTGIGIPETALDKLFVGFSQVDGSRTKKFAGTGLGLAISKQLAGIMKGEMGVKSSFGKGSIFWFTACFKTFNGENLENTTGDLKQMEEKPIANELVVLLVEDNKVNQIIASHTLKKMGCLVVMAKNGYEAIEAFKAQRFSVILMDIQMPEMNGLDATRHIRILEQEMGKSRVPIIAMTANAMSGDREMCLEAGMDEYISKPFNAEELGAKIQQLTM